MLRNKLAFLKISDGKTGLYLEIQNPSGSKTKPYR